MPVSDDIFYTANQSPACPFRDVNTPVAVFHRFFYGVNQEGSVCNTPSIVTFALQDFPKTSWTLVATVTPAMIRLPPTVFRRYIESLSLFHIKQALL